MLAGSVEPCLIVPQFPLLFFNCRCLGAGIVREALNALLLGFDIPDQGRILLFESLNLLVLLLERGNSLRPAQHDRGISPQPGERGDRSKRPKNRAWHFVREVPYILL